MSLTQTYEFLDGDGVTHDLIRTRDWSRSPLGPIESWSEALRLSVSLCLNSRFPLILWWGPELTMLYNDPYTEHLQSKHPSALGRPGKEVWSEIWQTIGPMLEGVFSSGKATWNDDLLLFLERNGFAEETYHTFSYSAIKDTEGRILGVFTPVAETTQRVLSTRRLSILREIGGTRSAEERALQKQLSDLLAVNANDIPCCAFLNVKLDSSEAEAFQFLVRDKFLQTASDEELLTHVKDAVNKRAMQVIDARALKLTEMPVSDRGAQPHQIVVVPVEGQSNEFFVLIAAVSPHLPFDEHYKAFYENLARELSVAIRETRTIEQEKRRAEILLELDKAKTTFFHNISHEFRTPLTLMIGPLEGAAATHASLTDDEVGLLLRNAQRLLKLVNNLLDFSRIEAGRYGAKFAETEVSGFTRDVAGVFRSAIESVGLTFIVNCEKISGAVFIDRDMWEKIVLNLLSNAFKFTLTGNITVNLSDRDDHIELVVSDTGCGIAQSDLPKVFDRFHRLQTTQARTQEGSGIGLALVRELVKLHGGRIGVSSEAGSGTSFSVTIPKGKSHLPADLLIQGALPEFPAARDLTHVREALSWNVHDNEDPGPTSERSGFTVLVADDNGDMRNYLQSILAQSHKVILARNGLEALNKIHEQKPDLLITDVMMPDMDGFELLSQIRANNETKRLPVIVLSARAGEEAKLEGLEKGADDYLVKPFSSKELLARVNLLLQSSTISQRLRTLVDERTEDLKEVSEILSDFVNDGDFQQASRRILRRALDATGAQYGFIGATIPGGPQGTTLRVFADLGFEWSKTVNRELYEKIVSDYRTKGFVDFPTLNNLFGWPILHRKPIVVNDPQNDERRSGNQPKGHPPTDSFLGVPIFKGELVVGSIGIANKTGGFLEADIDSLRHLLSAASVIYDSYRRLQHENRILQERALAEENLRRANDALMELAYSVSHELQEPLSSLRGNLSLLNARYRERLGMDADEFIRSALLANSKINTMVDDLWIYARIDRPHLRFGRVSMNELFDETVTALADRITSKSAAVTRGNLPDVGGERSELAVLIRKLLENSLIHSRQSPVITFTANNLIDEWVFCIADNGVGFLQTEAAEIFKMFRKLNRDKGASGMGLPIAKRIVEFHGGRMWAESEPGSGAKFYFTIPLRSAR